MKVYLYSPHGDKGYSLHIFYRAGDKDLYYALCGLSMRLDKKYDTHLFFQGDILRDGWLMLEFWTYNQDAILEFCMEFACTVGAELTLTDWGTVTLDEIEKHRLRIDL